ncbi:MAG: DUF922 domain-containing protein [Chloroflexi bacterium]|nr:DUF922 domain-containing protein [Chloroflexota bacterium]
MTRRNFALAVALATLAGACGGTTSPSTPGSIPPPTGSATPGPTQPPRSPVPTPATILALETASRPSGPWAVTFQSPGTESVREVYLLSAACPAPTCDLGATIQTWSGDRLGTATFTFDDGMYRLEVEEREVIDCPTPVETIADGATWVSHTSLLIAGYRAAGTAVVKVDIRGTRTVSVTPVGDNGCIPEKIEYIANGQETELAAAPTATPRPTRTTSVPGISKNFFGSGVTIETYRVGGASPGEIIASIRSNGPYSDWAKTRAEAVTRVVPKYRFELVGTGASCHVSITTRPAVIYVYTITLPRWSPPTGVAGSTISWWNDEIQSVARHERHHVELFRAGATRLSGAVASSTCANVGSRLATIGRDINRQNCEFDLKEYGTAMGLTLSSCLAN